MPSPFPGMNLYLEEPSFWAGIHQRQDLQTLLTEIYDIGSFDLRIDYQQPPLPPLNL
jgi:hypothetical protein